MRQIMRGAMIMTVISLICAYILNIADYFFTSYWVKLYGIEIETNPIGRWMLENNIAWVFKFLVVGGLFILLGHLIKRCPKVAPVAFVPLVVYGLIVVYHIFIYLMIKLVI